MEKSYDFLLGAEDPDISARLRLSAGPRGSLDRRFTQEEDFFLVLDRPFVVEPFEVHHDIRQTVPSDRYLGCVKSLVTEWTAQLPGVFEGLTWYFDPREPAKVLFLEVFPGPDRLFVFVLRIDLIFRGSHCDLVDRGTNDLTPKYSSRHLFVEAEVLPVEEMEAFPGGRRLYLHKLFPHTWQGETGTGYLVTGRWIDRDITRTLSRAALPPGFRTHPFYPLRCRFETLSASCPDPSPPGRISAARVLAAAWPLVEPWAGKIQDEFREDSFRDDHPLVDFLRNQWGGRLGGLWAPYRIEPYLNETDQKEYRYHGD